MADQWEEAAKQFKPSAQPVSTAPSANKDDWKVWQQQGTPSAQADIGEQPFTPAGTARVLGRSAMGFGKGLARSAYNLATGPGSGPLGMGAGYLLNKVGVTPKVMAATEPQNTGEKIGNYGEMAAELLVPMPKALSVLPNAERAGERFANVLAKAGNLPLDLTKASAPAIEAQQLSNAGATMPGVMTKFLERIPQHSSTPMNYAEGRRFAENAGRLSAEERTSSNPHMQKLVGDLADALKTANGEAAEKAGVGREYKMAIDEYRQAKKLGEAKDTALKIAKKYVLKPALYGAGIGSGYQIARHLGE